MTDELYRKEALAHRHRSLYGDVVLAAPLSTWFITLMICILCLILGAVLILADIQTNNGPVALWRWLLQRAG